MTKTTGAVECVAVGTLSEEVIVGRSWTSVMTTMTTTGRVVGVEEDTS